jgi:HTH-type transcriptional regulator / antitoxin PezA
MQTHLSSTFCVYFAFPIDNLRLDCYYCGKEVIPMGDRIKVLRQSLGLTQQEFADRIGIKRGAIANYEIGRNISDVVINSICRTFNVNEHWLRTGEGEMFVQISRDKEVMRFVGDVMRGEEDTFRRRFLLALARLPEERWADIEDFARQITAENTKEEQD